MFIPALEVSDKSYYTDELEKLTGRSRKHWTRFPLAWLKRRLAREMRRWVLENETRNNFARQAG